MPAKNYWPALSLLGLVMFAHQLHGDSIPITWLSSIGTTGNWSTASNWDLGVVPNNSDGTTYAVTIPMLRSVVVDISPTVDSLNAAGSHVEVISGNTLTTTLVHRGEGREHAWQPTLAVEEPAPSTRRCRLGFNHFTEAARQGGAIHEAGARQGHCRVL